MWRNKYDLDDLQQKMLVDLCIQRIAKEETLETRIQRICLFRSCIDSSLPTWPQLMYERLSVAGPAEVFEAFDKYLKLPEAEQFPPPRETVFDEKYAPFYAPPEVIEKQQKDLRQRVIDYRVHMSVIDSLYRNDLISAEEHLKINEVFSLVHGLPANSIFRDDDPPPKK